MTQEGFKRKLTTILSADAVEYSRLMGDDEAATVRTIELYRNIICDLITQHRGRVIDSPGDNLLSEFGSVVDAVQCAVAVQKELNARNAELPDNRQMKFRIGINLGDVIQEGDRIYGDGVNIAARLEGLAEPGGICVSKTAFDHIETKLPLGYEFLGEQEVKNIAKPVGAYRVLMEPRVTIAPTSEKGTPKPIWQRKTAIIAAFAAITLVTGLTVWTTYHRNVQTAPQNERVALLDLPDKPSIAVLPFDNLSGDPDQEYFSDGLTEDIIAALSRVPKLFVIASNSVFTYKGRPVKVQQVGRELGVEYVLEGSVKKSSDRIRITAQLIDATNGRHLWAKQYQRSLNDIFALQDEITKEIITAMQIKLTEGDQIRAAGKGTNYLEAYLLVLKANDYMQRANIENVAMAKENAKEAITIDPDYAAAYQVLARAYLYEFWTDPSKPQHQILAEANKLLEKAIGLDSSSAQAYSLLAWVCTYKRENEKAIKLANKAVSLNPNSAECHFWLGKVLTFAGKPEESILEFKYAIRLNPIPPSNYWWSLGLSYASMHQYDEAIKWCKKATQQEPDDLMARIMITAIYSMAGYDEKAQVEAHEVLRINPKFSLDRLAKRASPRLTEALRKSGLK